MKRINSSYISKVKVTGLCGELDIEWSVERGVNILSGVNGSGKSTIVHAISDLLTTGVFTQNPLKPISNIEILFEDGSVLSSENHGPIRKIANVDVISTFDSLLPHTEAVLQLTDGRVRSELDWQLYKVLDRFLKYQLAVGKKALTSLIKGGDKSEVESILLMRNKFFDILDDLFSHTGKVILRDRDEVVFTTNSRNYELTPYQLSSGEKQVLILLITALTQCEEPYILVMDEPEISLHFEWQKSLIRNIMLLNPSVQLLTSTHSPAVIMEGWISRVKDLHELSLDTF